jgi:small subunit ribosomal protein S16
MLRIRLSRTGKKKQASYRVVVADADAKRDGRVVERIGHYNPRTEPVDYQIDEGRALYWLSVGAQPSDAVQRLLVKQGTIDRLGRLHGGESLESLVAEYSGAEPEAAPAPAPVRAPAVEEVAAMVEDLVTDEEE